MRGRRARGHERGAQRRRSRPGTRPGCGAARRGSRGTARPTAARRPSRPRSAWNASTPCSIEMRSDSSPNSTASPSNAMRSSSCCVFGAFAGRIVAAAMPVVERARDVVGVRGQEQVARRTPARTDTSSAPRGERGAHDLEPVVLDRVEDPQTGVARVARQQDHLDARRDVRDRVERAAASAPAGTRCRARGCRPRARSGNARYASRPCSSNSAWLSPMSNSAREEIATTRRSVRLVRASAGNGVVIRSLARRRSRARPSTEACDVEEAVAVDGVRHRAPGNRRSPDAAACAAPRRRATGVRAARAGRS